MEEEHLSRVVENIIMISVNEGVSYKHRELLINAITCSRSRSQLDSPSYTNLKNIFKDVINLAYITDEIDTNSPWPVGINYLYWKVGQTVKCRKKKIAEIKSILGKSFHMHTRTGKNLSYQCRDVIKVWINSN